MVRRIRRTPFESLSFTRNCTFGPLNKPIATVEPGETFEVETWDASGNMVKPSQAREDASLGDVRVYENPVTGPIYVAGAQIGDILKVEIIDIRLPDLGWTSVRSIGGGLKGWLEPFSPLTKFSKISDRKITYRLNDGRRIEIPTRPFVGTIGVSPAFEAIATVTPGKHGGNMDAADVCVGNTLYLPVAADGALLGLGDVHAVQGDGEICGTAVEVYSTVTLKLLLEKNRKLVWPRIESKDEIMTVCSTKPLEDAVRLAFVELVKWLETDYNFEPGDAYAFLSLAAKVRVAQIVDPLFTVIAKLPKKMLPKKQVAHLQRAPLSGR